MKNVIVIFFLMLSVSLTSAQNNNNKIKLEKKGDVIEVTYYYASGEIEQQGFFKDGKRNGSWVSFNEQGEQTVIGHYLKGKKTGKWIFKMATSLKEVNYLDNKIISVTDWDKKSKNI